jgi:DNA-binding response OmpR family regulator
VKGRNWDIRPSRRDFLLSFGRPDDETYQQDNKKDEKREGRIVAKPATSTRHAITPKPCAHLLVVDDDPEVRSMLSRLLEAEGYKTERAATGTETMEKLSHRHADLVILDVMLAGENGFELLATIRRTNDIPVILLSGRDGESDRVLGLRLGADDYVTKPFSSAELAARVASVLRRVDRRHMSNSALLEFGELSIDLLAREVKVSGKLVPTTAKEFDLLAFIARSPRQVFSREQLLAHVWGSSSDWQDDGTVTEHVRRVRRKIETNPEHPRWVRTVRGVGYRFEP